MLEEAETTLETQSLSIELRGYFQGKRDALKYALDITKQEIAGR